MLDQVVGRIMMTLGFMIFMALFGFQAFAADIVIVDVKRNIPMSDEKEVFQDFYINAGLEAGLKKSLVVKAVRKVPIRDHSGTQALGELLVPVGQLRIIHAQPGLSVGRLYKIESRDEAPVLDQTGIMAGDRIDLTGAFVGKAPPRKVTTVVRPVASISTSFAAQASPSVSPAVSPLNTASVSAPNSAPNGVPNGVANSSQSSTSNEGSNATSNGAPNSVPNSAPSLAPNSAPNSVVPTTQAMHTSSPQELPSLAEASQLAEELRASGHAVSAPLHEVRTVAGTTLSVPSEKGPAPTSDNSALATERIVMKLQPIREPKPSLSSDTGTNAAAPEAESAKGSGEVSNNAGPEEKTVQ